MYPDPRLGYADSLECVSMLGLKSSWLASCFFSPFAAAVVTDPQSFIHTQTCSFYMQYSVRASTARTNMETLRDRYRALKLGNVPVIRRHPKLRSNVSQVPGKVGVWILYTQHSQRHHLDNMTADVKYECNLQQACWVSQLRDLCAFQSRCSFLTAAVKQDSNRLSEQSYPQNTQHTALI